MPMTVAFSSHGAYLASAYFAMPDDAGTHTVLPAGSYGRVYADRFESYNMPSVPIPISEIDVKTYINAYRVIEGMLKEQPCRIKALRLSLDDIFPKDDLNQSTLMVYEILGSLLKRGEIECIVQRVESDFEGIDAPRFFYQFKK